jgi:hypothetical protein
VAFHRQQVRAGDDDGEALGAGDGDVEAVFREQKADVARQGVFAGSGHRDDDHRGFLALEFVDGADARAGRQRLPQQVDLHVVGGDDEDVVDADAVFLAVAVDEVLMQQVVVQGADAGGFFRAFLAVAGMGDGEEADAGFG